MARYNNHIFASLGDSSLVAPHLSDTSFEVDAGFDFEQIGNDFQHVHSQTTPDDSYNDMVQGQNFNVTMAYDAYESDSKRQMGQHETSEMYPFELMSPSDFWPTKHASFEHSSNSQQTDMATKLTGNANQKFGQLTSPGDEFSSQESVGIKRQPLMYPQSSESPPMEISTKEKSERARHAAYQRHAMTKTARKDSRVEALSPQSDTATSSEDKREKYREKNRLAAAKCRAKKKSNVEDLEDKAREITALNSQLKLQARELRDAFSALRSHALMHDPSQGCACQQMHLYNANKAQETARGAVAPSSFLNAEMQNHDFMDPLTACTFDTSKSAKEAQSLSRQDYRPDIDQHSQSRSLIDPTLVLEDLSFTDVMQEDNHEFDNLEIDE